MGHAFGFTCKKPAINHGSKPIQIGIPRNTKSGVINVHACRGESPQFISIFYQFIVERNRFLPGVVAVYNGQDFPGLFFVVTEGDQNLLSNPYSFHLVKPLSFLIFDLWPKSAQLLLLRHHLPTHIMQQDGRQDNVFMGFRIVGQQPPGKIIGYLYMDIVLARIQVRFCFLVNFVVYGTHNFPLCFPFQRSLAILVVTPTLSPSLKCISLERRLRSDQAISRKAVSGTIETQNLNVIRKLAKNHRFRAFRVAK